MLCGTCGIESDTPHTCSTFRLPWDQITSFSRVRINGMTTTRSFTQFCDRRCGYCGQCWACTECSEDPDKCECDAEPELSGRELAIARADYILDERKDPDYRKDER